MRTGRAVAVSGRPAASKAPSICRNVDRRRLSVIRHFSTAAQPTAVEAGQQKQQRLATQPQGPLGRLALDSLTSASVGTEVMHTLTGVASTSQSYQVLDALSKAALLLRDTALGGSGQDSYTRAQLQALFQSGYDISVSLLQALPHCPDAYYPASVVPETAKTLFHLHNLLLQAAYASQQDFEPYTELMQAGLGLYLLKAPRPLVAFSNGQLDDVLDALAHQDMWRLQRLLWQQVLACMPKWDNLQDLCSVVTDCEQQAMAAATAAAAAAAQPPPPTPAPPPPPPPGPVRVTRSTWRTALDPDTAYSTTHAADPHPTSTTDPWVLTSNRTSTTAAASSSLYDKRSELEEYGRLMSECIRTALETAAVKLPACADPPAAARQLLDAVAAFDARQRSHTAPPSLRYTFMPSPEWLTAVAEAGMRADERLPAAQVVQLLQDLDALAPKPLESSEPTTEAGTAAPPARRWLGPAGQAAVEAAVLRHLDSNAWSTQQAMTVVQALSGKCQRPPSDKLCSAVEGLMLACGAAQHDTQLLCTMLQDAVAFACPAGGSSSAQLSRAHSSLVRTALNRAVCVVGTAMTGGEGAAGGGQAAAADAREFLFDRYPSFLRAARRFSYPVEAFRVHDYATELYTYFASAPGHELVAVGPEGFTRAIQAVEAAPCCHDPHWAAGFERAVLTLVAVQFSVGYTHPKRWLGLLRALVHALPFPMPSLAAGVKAMCVRLCDTARHAEYFYSLLPLMGTLERRASAMGSTAGGTTGWEAHQAAQEQLHLQQHHRHLRHGNSHGGGSALQDEEEHLQELTNRFKMSHGGMKRTSSGGAAGGSSTTGSHASTTSSSSGSSGTHPKSKSPGPGGFMGHAPSSGPRSWRKDGVYSSSASNARSSTAGGAAASGGLPALPPPPDISRYLVSEEEFARWEYELGRRLALSMACARDQEVVARRLLELGISRG